MIFEERSEGSKGASHEREGGKRAIQAKGAIIAKVLREVFARLSRLALSELNEWMIRVTTSVKIFYIMKVRGEKMLYGC